MERYQLAHDRVGAQITKLPRASVTYSNQWKVSQQKLQGVLARLSFCCIERKKPGRQNYTSVPPMNRPSHNRRHARSQSIERLRHRRLFENWHQFMTRSTYHTLLAEQTLIDSYQWGTRKKFDLYQQSHEGWTSSFKTREAGVWRWLLLRLKNCNIASHRSMKNNKKSQSSQEVDTQSGTFNICKLVLMTQVISLLIKTV